MLQVDCYILVVLHVGSCLQVCQCIINTWHVANTQQNLCVLKTPAENETTSGEILVVKKISVETQRNAVFLFFLNYLLLIILYIDDL